jgi:hypothetical protein
MKEHLRGKKRDKINSIDGVQEREREHVLVKK